MLNKFRILLKNPEFIIQFRSRKTRLAKFFGSTEQKVQNYFDETIPLWNFIQERQKNHGAYERMSLERLQILYSCVREYKPKTMVETGVAGGSTSFFTLKAMEKNGFGNLYSIDIDNPIWHDHADYEVGWIIPKEMRANWKLTIGDSRTELPILLDSLKQIQAFFHDSDHSYEHMKFEFKTAFSYLDSKKLILADDINLNSSLDDFSKTHKLQLEKFYGFGVACIKS